MLAMNYSNSDPSPAYGIDTTHAPALFRSSMLQDANFADEPGTVSSLKASKFLQILRKWGTQSRKPAAAGRVVLSQRSTARSFSCSRLNLVPLRCLSMQLHSDDEDEEENEATTHNAYMSNQSQGSPRFISQCVPARALSCPKLSSPLSSCTPFSNINFDEQTRDEEEFECLNPSSVRNEESKSSTTSKGSSPLKLNLNRQPSTPRGYLALYVGEERKRFVVKANLVNHPLFGVLLEKAKEEFGFEQQGALNIPCEIAFFQHIMLLVESNDPFYKNADQSTILLHLNNNSTSTVA